MEPLLLEVPDCCEVMHLGRTKFLELLYTGAIPSIKIGSRRLIPADALRHWIEEQTAEHAG